MLNTHYYRNNAANYMYKSAISPSSSSPHGGCSILNTYYYRNNPANFIYKFAMSSYSSSPHGSCSMFVQPRSPAVSTSGRTLNVVLLARASQGAAVSHAVTPDHSEQIFRGAGPINSFFFGGSKLLLPGARPGSKTNFLVAKLDVHFYAMKIY